MRWPDPMRMTMTTQRVILMRITLMKIQMKMMRYVKPVVYPKLRHQRKMPTTNLQDTALIRIITFNLFFQEEDEMNRSKIRTPKQKVRLHCRQLYNSIYQYRNVDNIQLIDMFMHKPSKREYPDYYDVRCFIIFILLTILIRRSNKPRCLIMLITGDQ